MLFYPSFIHLSHISIFLPYIVIEFPLLLSSFISFVPLVSLFSRPFHLLFSTFLYPFISHFFIFLLFLSSLFPPLFLLPFLLQLLPYLFNSLFFLWSIIIPVLYSFCLFSLSLPLFLPLVIVFSLSHCYIYITP